MRTAAQRTEPLILVGDEHSCRRFMSLVPGSSVLLADSKTRSATTLSLNLCSTLNVHISARSTRNRGADRVRLVVFVAAISVPLIVSVGQHLQNVQTDLTDRRMTSEE